MLTFCPSVRSGLIRHQGILAVTWKILSWVCPRRKGPAASMLAQMVITPQIRIWLLNVFYCQFGLSWSIIGCIILEIGCVISAERDQDDGT